MKYISQCFISHYHNIQTSRIPKANHCTQHILERGVACLLYRLQLQLPVYHKFNITKANNAQPKYHKINFNPIPIFEIHFSLYFITTFKFL
ncbi:hypothetical protein BGP_1730 [Beggiatoa sp. PS]|nr:hypothetical protein BGP_1730 [Beggiatoa sp. PS]